LLEPGPAPDGASCAGCDAGAAGAAGATCSDAVRNGDETAIDCGGGCGACDPGPAATCSDGLSNQGEAAVDCGGPCAACDAGPAVSCSDGVQNQGETAIDCGGPCAACDAGPVATCSDGVVNQDETGVDCGGACPACIPTSCTQVVADSAAEFSNVQGQAGWRYGYYAEPSFTSAAFIELSDYRFGASVGAEGWFTGDTWTWVGRVRMHPNGRLTSGGRPAIDQHAVRRWISPTTETLFVQGTLRSTNAVSSGIIGRIRVNDTEVWQRVVAAGDTQPQAVQALATVRVGDAVNLTLDPYQSNDAADDTEFSVQLCR
jgi:hypothetical protein